MKLLSVNVGLPREVIWNGKPIETGIYKNPVEGRVNVSALNLDGDKQADLTVHGGIDMAVYAYPSEYYEHWRNEFHGQELPWGSFGENFAISDINDTNVHIGDVFEIGSAQFQVTQPRMPCFKLGIKFEDQGMIKRFLDARTNGFYFRVLKEGDVGAEDEVSIAARDEHKVRVRDIVELYVGNGSSDLIERALKVDALPESWKSHLQRKTSS